MTARFSHWLTGTMSTLLSPAELAALVDAGSVRVLDVQYTLAGDGPALYAAAHLPQAPHLDLDAVLAGPPGAGGRHPLPEPAALEAGLRRVGVRDGDAVVPELFLGDWHNEWRSQDGTEEGTSDITIVQGSFGDPVLRYTEAGDTRTCTWENRLVQVGERELVLGPDTLVADSNGDCGVFAGFRLWAEEDDDSTIRIAWLDDPEGDPHRYHRNE